jgi:hypothetical protein
MEKNEGSQEKYEETDEDKNNHGKKEVEITSTKNVSLYLPIQKKKGNCQI